MTKPNIFVVGAPKSGTTSLYAYFLRHPEIFVPDDKEPHFFGELSADGRKKYGSREEYCSIYNKVKRSEAFVADMSTSYLYSKDAALEIYNFNPQAKIVAFLRNPADRAMSMYYHQRRSMRESFCMQRAFKEEENRIRNGWPYGFHYFNVGLYSEQVKRYKSVFGENFKVFYFEDFVKDPEKTLRELQDFLGSQEKFWGSVGKENKTGVPRSSYIQEIISYQFFGKKFIKRVLGKRNLSRLRDLNTGGKSETPQGFREELLLLYREDVELLSMELGDIPPWDVI